MQFKKNKNKIYKSLVIAFMYIASIIAMIFGGINIGKNNTQKGLFGDSYFMSFELDLSKQTTKAEKEKVLQENSEAFSRWLSSQNINNISVQYELKEEVNNTYKGFLYTDILNVDLVDYREEEKQQNPYWIALDTIKTSRINVFQYNPTVQSTKNDLQPSYTGSEKYGRVFSQENIDANSAKKDMRDDPELNNNGIQVNLIDTNLNITKFNDQKLNTPASEADNIKWFVFQDLDVLIQKLNYAKYLALKKETENNETNVFNFDTLPTPYQEWATIAKNYGDPISEEFILHYYIESSNNVNENSVYNSKLKPIIDEYIIGTIDYTNYNKWFPDAKVIGDTSSGDGSTGGDTGGTGGDTGGTGGTTTYQTSANGTETVSRVSFQLSNPTIQNQEFFIKRLKEMTFSVPLIKINDKWEGSSKNPLFNEFRFVGKSWINRPYLAPSITTMDAYESSLLALGVVILLIAIIVSILYRIPGVFGGMSIISSAVLSTSLFVVLNINFSIPAILAIIISLISSLTAVLLVMERMRKNAQERMSVFDSITLITKKSLFTILDINVIILGFGLSFVFFGQGELIDFGLALILVSLVTVASSYLLFIFPFYLISGFTNLWDFKYHLIYKKLTKKQLVLSKNKVNKYNSIIEKSRRKAGIPLLVIAFVIILIGIILAFTIGIQNSSAYNNGTIVYVTVAQNQIGNVISKLGSGWTKIGYSNGVLSLSHIGTFTQQHIANLLTGIVTNPTTDIDVTVTAPTFNFLIADSAMKSCLIAMGFLSVYYVFRLNVFVVIPLFLVNLSSMLLPIALIYLVWIPIDSFFVYSMIFVSMISTISSVIYVSITKTRFNKRELFENENIMKFVVANIGNLKFVYLGQILMITLLSAVMMLLGSTSTILMFGYIIIGSLFGIIFSHLFMAALYFVVLVIRQQYVRNFTTSLDARLTEEFKEVDEELIQNINKFS